MHSSKQLTYRRSIVSLLAAAVAVLAVIQLCSEQHPQDVVLMQKVEPVSTAAQVERAAALLTLDRLIQRGSSTLTLEQLPNKLGKVEDDEAQKDEEDDAKEQSHGLSYGWHSVSSDELQKIMQSLNNPKQANHVAAELAKHLLQRKGITNVQGSDD